MAAYLMDIERASSDSLVYTRQPGRNPLRESALVNRVMERIAIERWESEGGRALPPEIRNGTEGD